MTRKDTLVLKIKRHPGQPWGFRIAGGVDLGTPIIVTRSENEDLQKGDVIKKIDEYDGSDLRHVDAQDLLVNTNSVKLVVDRQKKSKDDKILPKSPVPPMMSPKEYKTYSPDHFEPPHEHLDEVREERFYLSQPYRTTPLVLPGAKVKKDAPLGESYLRHHPNPMIRAAPHHYEVAHPEVAMKQKVVHKQFNSPIGLYSEQNIADSIKCQASAIPAMKPAKYDPTKSEAYKALQEEEYGDNYQEINQPARGGVYAPQKAHHNRVNPPKSPAPSHTSAQNDEEIIHQSNSFRRIMYSVLGHTDY